MLAVSADRRTRQPLLSWIAFRYHRVAGNARKLRARERERERTLAQRWTVIALYYSKVTGAEYRETWFLIRDIICSTTWALFHELAGRKQIVPREPREPRFLRIYRIHIHANNCNNSVARVIDTHVRDYEVSGGRKAAR